ncbi:hypothetical protein TREMEDRAFT_68834 [Tremella mesenterica DSM 1558]|uniref:uncharacterized protein n=1 Tax=Tremella mesenterica (strain ATCC 24925 / CBS 8224 / DSM 1558 / NBRC 9311 / NRRL Y-6157 / RJB 2259-6 / UBC 559-6) TaxID=578456 RepID=UPI0003F49280|nr:uncharacterized protein TREMEDRAFT_68834 [Tremella mesenterica DSM 1558]EIW68868.1 hypothetical protein TREMEDRAFT_68834 [Tremella mesenterica DSM 1558]
MTTIPARLARLASPPASLEEARRRTINAYRAWYRSAPEIVTLYSLNISPSMIRLKKRQDFERNRDITDLSIINILLQKNQQEFQETMNCWKQEPHIMHWFKTYSDPPAPQTFLDKFYAGRDDPKQIASF